MHISYDDLSEKNFDFGFCACSYNNIMAGIEAYQRHITDNKEFFSYDKGKSLKGHLLTFAVERAFYNSAFKPISEYSVIVGKLNDYGYNGLYIRTEDFLLNISRTRQKFSLPRKSGYRAKLSNCNSDLEIQMRFDSETGSITFDDFKYAIITYGYENDTLSHMGIVMPSHTYSHLLYRKNLLENISVYQNTVPETAREEQISKLNDEIQRALLNKAGEKIEN